MVDQEGVNVMEEMEQNYANAGNASMGRRPVSQQGRSVVEDERMPDEWNRARNQDGEIVGFIGQRPIIRPAGQDDAEDDACKEDYGGSQGEVNSGVMAALARLRQQ